MYYSYIMGHRYHYVDIDVDCGAKLKHKYGAGFMSIFKIHRSLKRLIICHIYLPTIPVTVSSGCWILNLSLIMVNIPIFMFLPLLKYNNVFTSHPNTFFRYFMTNEIDVKLVMPFLYQF